MVLVLVVSLLQQCTTLNRPNTKKISMDNSKKDNKIYSRTIPRKFHLLKKNGKRSCLADVYYISSQKGTERPGTSKYEHSKEVGTYYCAACGNALFQSDTKFESGCGWPSFYEPISKGSIIYAPIIPWNEQNRSYVRPV